MPNGVHFRRPCEEPGIEPGTLKTDPKSIQSLLGERDVNFVLRSWQYRPKHYVVAAHSQWH